MNKISLEDYEKLEKFNLEQQKALRENAMVIANLEMEKKQKEERFEIFRRRFLQKGDKDLKEFIYLFDEKLKKLQINLKIEKDTVSDLQDSIEDSENDLQEEIKKVDRLANRVINLRSKCKNRNFRIKVLYLLLIISNLITFDITYHYKHSNISYTQYSIEIIFDWYYAFFYMSYIIFNDMLKGIYRCLMYN